MDERTNFIWLKEQTGFGEHPASGLFYHHRQGQFHCQPCWPHLFSSKSSGMKFIGGEIPAPWKQQERTVVWGLCDVGSRNSTLDSETLHSYHSPVRSSPMQTAQLPLRQIHFRPPGNDLEKCFTKPQVQGGFLPWRSNQIWVFKQPHKGNSYIDYYSLLQSIPTCLCLIKNPRIPKIS